jgi:5-methylcytosine-specific restriction endonuclease McrA
MKKGFHLSQSTKDKIRIAHLGVKRPGIGGVKKGNTPWNKGKPHLSIRGDKNPNWRGGISHNSNSRHCKIRYYRTKNGFHSDYEWELLKKQYGFVCPCCKKSEPEIKLQKDHIIPVSKGGSNFIENIQPLCRKCNGMKYTKIMRYLVTTN